MNKASKFLTKAGNLFLSLVLVAGLVPAAAWAQVAPPNVSASSAVAQSAASQESASEVSGVGSSSESASAVTSEGGGFNMPASIPQDVNGDVAGDGDTGDADSVRLGAQAADEDNEAADASAADNGALTTESSTGQFAAPVQARSAVTSFAYSGGTGTKEDPYLIASESDFAALSEAVNAGENQSGGYFQLAGDVEISAEDFQPIGIYTTSIDYPFAGTFDGAGHTVTVNFTYKGSGQTGLFGYISGESMRAPATIKNLVVAGSVTAKQPLCGAVAGYAKNAVIESCGNEAAVSGTTYVGGICGSSMLASSSARPNTVRVLKCYNTGAVTGARAGAARIGGIMGAFGAAADAEITDCYNGGDVSAGGTMVGGLVGYWYNVSGASAYMDNCYNYGTVTGGYRDNTCALVGDFDGTSTGAVCSYITNCHTQALKAYCNGTSTGKLFGWYGDNVQVEGQSIKTADEMPTAAFADALGESYAQTATYPVLRWQAPLNPTVGAITATGITDEGGLAVGAATTLTVDARLPMTGEGSAGTLSYQWYCATSDVINPQTDMLLDAQGAQAQVSVPATGDYYFYCVVTNTLDGQSASLASPAFKISALSGVEAAQPVFTQQPQSGQRPQEGDDFELSVAVDETAQGIGTLSYQWYVISGAQGEGASAEGAPGAEEGQTIEGQLIDGATEPTYVASAAYAGMYTYYCVVTNTFDLVQKTAISDYAQLVVAPCEIATPEELVAFAQRVNGSSVREETGENLEGKSFVLVNDIDLSGIDWAPIGTYYSDVVSPSNSAMNEFSGTFDGTGHTISGLKVDKEKLSYWQTAYAGLFGYTVDATIKNLVVEGSIAADGMYHVGGIVGCAMGSAALENLVFEGSISGSSRVGGIVGTIGETSGASTVQSCGVRGTVEARGYAAGIAGVAGNTSFSNCYNWANVQAQGYVAGIVGSVYQGYNLGNVSIGNCYNVGTVNVSQGGSDSTVYFGAIVSDYATAYPENNYYLESSCTQDATLGSPQKNLAKSQTFLRSAEFVSLLNAHSGLAQNAFAASTQGMYPVFAWEHQIPTCAVTIQLSPAGAHDATVEVRNEQGVLCLPIVLEGSEQGVCRYYLPEGSYTVKAAHYGFETLQRAFEVTQTANPLSISLEMQQAPTQNVAFSVTSAAGASTEDALLWLESEEFGLIKQEERASSFGVVALPVGTYQYTWVLSNHMSARGTFEVTTEGAQSGETLQLPAQLASPAAWDGTQEAPAQSKDGYYLVTSGEELAWCAKQVNQGASRTNIRLMAPIILNASDNYAYQWTPIGCGTQVQEGLFEGVYAGSFDGQGYDISGLYIDTESNYQALFGVVGDGATIANVVVGGFVRTAGSYAAGLAAYLDTATVSITNCGNEATVSGRSNVGGIIGQLWSGSNHAVTVSYCYNKGAITSTEATNYEAGMVGGLVGSALTGDETSLILKSCYNAGSVLALSHTAGGILGTGSCTLQNCYNRGSVEHRSLSEVYPNASGSLIGVWPSTGVALKVDNSSYLEGTNPRAFGYVTTPPTVKADVFTGPEYFSSIVLIGYEGFVKRYGSAYNDGYPYLSWENTSRVAPSLPALPGTAANPYKITSVQDLQQLAQNVANGRAYSGEYFQLEADLNLDGVDFAGIGTYANGNGGYFSGTFDGTGHSITGINIDRHTTDILKDEGAGVGLFGYTRNATIKHLEVAGEASGTIWVGGIVGYGYATHIEDCLSRVNVSARSFMEDDGQGIFAGGIAGQIFADVTGDGGVTSCAFFGTSTGAGIVGLGSSAAGVAGNYYVASGSAQGTDLGNNGATPAAALDTLEIAWGLNTCDGTIQNTLTWGLGDAGVCFADGQRVVPAYRVLMDESAALLSANPEYRQADEATTVTIDQVKKGYTLTTGVVAQVKTDAGEFETIYSGSKPATVSAAFEVPAVASDVYVSVGSIFNRNTAYDLTAQVVSADGTDAAAGDADAATSGAGGMSAGTGDAGADASGAGDAGARAGVSGAGVGAASDDAVQRSAQVTFKDEEGNVITTARRGQTVYAYISDIDANSQFKSAFAEGRYDAQGLYTTAISVDEQRYGRIYAFTVPDADVTFAVELEQKGTLPSQRDESLEVQASNFHVANAAYAQNGTLLNSDFIVDDDGTAGISTAYTAYPQQSVATIYDVEGGLTSADYYSQIYTTLDAEGNRTSAQYTGVNVERFLTVWCQMSKSLDPQTAVTFISGNGDTRTLTVGDILGYSYSSYVIDGDYAGDFVARGLPVLLAAGKDGVPFNPESEGGPLRLVVGQKSYDDANQETFLDNVVKIVVGDVSQAISATHQRSPYSSYLDAPLYIDVYRAGSFVKTVSVTLAQIEELQAAGAHESAWITGARFGEGGTLQNVDELDHYQGINVWQMLQALPEVGITSYDVATGSVGFYEDPVNLWSSYSLVAQVPLSYLAGSASAGVGADSAIAGNYTDCETIANGLVTTGVAPQIATAKNGLPLVRSSNEAGAVEDEYNYRGPFIGVLPYSQSAGVEVAGGGEKNAYIASFLGRIVLNLGEASDKTDLKWLLDGVEKDIDNLVASEDGTDVATTDSWVPTKVWAALVEAQTAAQAVADDASATTDQVDTAYVTLSAAWQQAMDTRHDPATVATQAVSDAAGIAAGEGAAGDTESTASGASDGGAVGVAADGAATQTAASPSFVSTDETADTAAASTQGSALGAPKSIASTDAGQYVANEILVTFEKETSKGQALGALSCFDEADDDALPHEVSEADVSAGAPVVVKLDEGVNVLDAVDVAKQQPGVASAQPNFVYSAFETNYDTLDDGYTNDPALSSTSPSSVSPNAWQLASINAFKAWDIVKTNNTVTVAVLDTGCYLTHEDLKNQIWQDYAWNATLSSTLTKDYNGHGTHVAGLAAAEANNALGTAGSSYNAKILPIGVFDTAGENCYTSTLVAAYDYLLGYADELNIHVVNMSLGGYGTLDSSDYLLQERIATAKDNDIVTVAAGGNGDDYGNPITSSSWPSDFEDCIAVTALSTDGVSPTTWCDYNSAKDICAPGMYLYSTYSSGADSYKVMSGTSMASPVVAGAMALLWAADPDLTVDEAKDLVYSTAAPLTVPSGREGLYGHGILNIGDAIQALSGLVIDAAPAGVYSSQTLQMTCRSTNGQALDDIVWSVENGTGTATIDTSTGLLTGLMPGTVRVTATLPAVEGMTDTIEVSVKALEMAGAPAVVSTQEGLDVSWDAAPYAAGYVLERSADGQEFELVATLSAETLSYADAVVEENVLYFYRVTPFSSVAQTGTGAPSDAARSMKFQLITMISGETALATSDEALALAVDVFASRNVKLDVLVLVSDADDAWAENAAALAAAGSGYVVAVGSAGLSDAALAAIAQLAPEKILALGDETSVSEQALSQAAQAAGGVVVQRVSADTRTMTDVAAVKAGLGTWGNTVVVSAPSHVDAALQAASLTCAGQGAPVLLTKEDQAPFEVETLLAAKHFDKALVLGDDSVIPAAADGFLARQGLEVERISVQDVSATVAQRAVDAGASWSITSVYAGENPAISQVAASFAAVLGGVSVDASQVSLQALSAARAQVQASFVFAPQTLAETTQQAVSDALNGVVEEADFEVGAQPFASHYTLVTYKGVLPAGTGIMVMGTPMVKCGNVYCGLVDTAAVASITAADFRLTDQPSQELTQWGDVNENGLMNVVDAQLSYDLATGVYGDFSQVSLRGWLAADYNRDGVIDAADAFAIQISSLDALGQAAS